MGGYEMLRRQFLWCLLHLTIPCSSVIQGSFMMQAQADEGITLGACRFAKTFSEDFKAFHVHPRSSDGSSWIAHTPWNGDFGDAAFSDPRPGFPFVIDDSGLTIEARKDTAGRWRSGLLASADGNAIGFAQQFGYFELKAKLPEGDGLWPAFWLATSKPAGVKEDTVEIDVMEHYGRSPADFHSVVHVWRGSGGGEVRAASHVTPVSSGSLYSDYRTYGVDVEADTIVFYLDRREVWRTASPPELKRPLAILVNLALGSGWPIDKAPSPSFMRVAYIHVFKKDGCNPR